MYYLKNKDMETAYSARHYKNNKKYYINKAIEYKKQNIIKVTDYQNKYSKHRKQIDINFKLACNLRTRLHQAIKNNQKVGSAVKDLGCSIDEFKVYMESLFTEGMTWENYGKWHIDHIKPLARFNLSDREELLKACNYTNLQPLWAKDNLKKGAKYE